MAKNIVICCDGTGNEFGDHNSNVVKLYSTLIIDHIQQVGYYHPGVGTMGSPTATNKLSKAWSVLKGLAFGAGLLTNVGDAPVTTTTSLGGAVARMPGWNSTADTKKAESF